MSRRSFKGFLQHTICLLLASLFALFLPVAASSGEETASDQLIIHYLDVGQGDAAILQCGGQTLLIDGGDRYTNQLIYSYLTRTLELDYLDYIISTHPHDDHVKGLATALVACDAGVIYSPVTEYDGDGFLDLISKMADRGLEITIPQRGDSFSLGSAEITFLSAPDSSWDLNDQSLIVRAVFGQTSFLFTGDAAWEAEQSVLASGMELKSDVLKVGHHGSATSTSQGFLDAVQPSYAVISVGADNKYGHPADETLAKLERSRTVVYRTDKQGTITCVSDGESITFTSEKKSRKW